MLKPFARMIKSGLDPSTRGAPQLLLFFADDRYQGKRGRRCNLVLSNPSIRRGSGNRILLSGGLGEYPSILPILAKPNFLHWDKKLVCGLLLGIRRQNIKGS